MGKDEQNDPMDPIQEPQDRIPIAGVGGVSGGARQPAAR